jgi:hypothetical protein
MWIFPWSKVMCGRLLKSMYGPRGAAQNWEHSYSDLMESVRSCRGKGSPCVFYHPAKQIRSVIHGDDFAILAKEKDLNWFREVMVERFEVKFRGRLGTDKTDDKLIRILNRIVQWNNEGISYDAEQSHAEITIAHQGRGKESKLVVTRGEKDLTQAEDDDQELDS